MAGSALNGDQPSCAILGTGAAQGDRAVASIELDRRHGLPEGTTERACGVRTRRYCDASDQISLAGRAARAALEDAEVGLGELDAILHAAAVPWQAIPSTAPLVQRALGIPDGAVAAFDVNASCLGFIAALHHARAAIAGGIWRRVLIVSSERASRGLDWRVPGTAGLFGDGAGAAVVGAASHAANGPVVMSVRLETHPSAYDASALVAGGTRLDHDAEPDAFELGRRFAMDGPALFALTRRHFARFVAETLEPMGWTLADVDCVVPHQASPLALRHMARALGLSGGRLVDISADHGNQIAASLPIALDTARRRGMAGPGAKVLMLGTAAGVSFGAAAIRM